MELLVGLAITALAIAAVHGWFSDKSTRIKEDEHNRALRVRLEQRERDLIAHVSVTEAELARRMQYTRNMQTEFTMGLLRGRGWLAQFIAEANQALDDSIVQQMRNKVRPALKAAEEVAEARAERRQLKERAKFLEYQLKSLMEYFPFLEEYQDVILDEAVQLSSGMENVTTLEESDPVLRFIPKAEYDRLSTAERNQRALDRYLLGRLSQAAVGRMYERYIGYLYEKEGWAVEYHGIIEGYEDLGRDLVCSKGDQIRIVQAKCWSHTKTIHEKHIFQLFGTSQLFLIARHSTDIFPPSLTASFVTSTSLSEVARQAANRLKIDVKEEFALDKGYPMVKCNINQRTREKIYHLPFDQQYDRTKITPAKGEFYASTVGEAEEKGFRRAFRYTGSERSGI